MRIRVVRASLLDGQDRAVWLRALQRQPSDACLVSPFQCPQYIEALAAVRRDVYVAVMQEAGGQVIGFFPFQRNWLGVGQPAGSPISDYEGPILVDAAAPTGWSLAELLRGCRLRGLDFSTVPATHPAFEPHAREALASPVMDVAGGYRVGPGEQRKIRKFQREVGPLRFEPHVRDPRVLEQVMRLKSGFYRRMNSPDLFRRRWIGRLLRHLHEMHGGGSGDEFRSLLSVLYVGDMVAAAHFGLCYRHVWHWWFPCYDPAYGRYSPGLIMLMMMAQHAPALGVGEIHFGEGYDFFKHRLKTREVTVWRGQVGWTPRLPPILRYEPARWLRRRIAQTRLAPLARAIRDACVGRARRRGSGALCRNGPEGASHI